MLQSRATELAVSCSGSCSSSSIGVAREGAGGAGAPRPPGRRRAVSCSGSVILLLKHLYVLTISKSPVIIRKIKENNNIINTKRTFRQIIHAKLVHSLILISRLIPCMAICKPVYTGQFGQLSNADFTDLACKRETTLATDVSVSRYNAGGRLTLQH